MEQSLLLIKQIFEKTNPSSCAVAFSGGKESIVLVHLLSKVLNDLNMAQWPPCVLFVEEKYKDSIMTQSMIKFASRHLCSTRFPLHIVSCNSMKEGLVAFMNSYTNITTFFLGTRASDGVASAPAPVAGTSEGWPELTRVMPLFSWSYAAIWKYIDDYALDYPSAYKDGYTSLGHGDGRPNPRLRRPDGSYSHARELKDVDTERKDRVS
jgi:3'-phosphoadenosine 5'-phosphosulfate sulfotransferase (PAPS reductase)/FAD synthetase